MKDNVVPTICLPTKSHDSITKERRILVREYIPEVPSTSKPIYKNFTDLCNRASNLKLRNWILRNDENCVYLHLPSPEFRIPKFEIFVKSFLEVICLVIGWRVPKTNDFYHFYSLDKTTLSVILNKLEELSICEGIDCNVDFNVTNHAVPCTIDLNDPNEVPYRSKSYNRPCNCLVLVSSGIKQCKSCVNVTKNTNKAKARKEKRINTPARLHAPLSHTHPNRVALALQEQRQLNKELQAQIAMEIASKSVNVDDDLANDINEIMDKTDHKSDFMKLFWEQQKIAASPKKDDVPPYDYTFLPKFGIQIFISL